MWSFNNNIAYMLKLFTGAEKVKSDFDKYKEPKKRIYLSELSQDGQNKVIDFFDKNKFLVIADVIKGRGSLSANWILICKTEENSDFKEWKLVEINNAINFLCQGDVHITERGSLSIGKITMQRKGGTPDPTSLQFKFHPLDLFEI